MFQFYTKELALVERAKVAAASVNKNILYFEDFGHAEFDKFGYPARTLSCHMYQRSCDVALGLPFNIASYAILTHMVAQQVNMIPDELIMSFGDIHVYNNHIHGLRNQLLQPVYTLPKLEIQKAKDIFSYNMEDFKLINYKHSPKVKYEVAV
jgi:thymidylate synthase